jgi:phosphoribosylformimino-5-aminoimidazole carboxamide ribotide isomerase
MKYRPCIDLRQGKVVQIVGGSLDDHQDNNVKVNFTSEKTPETFAGLYRDHQLVGGHVISLGPNNESAVKAALGAFPGGMHYGGGVNIDNAKDWLDAGASHVIVTSYVFNKGQLHHERLKQLVKLVGKDRLVLDLSCRKRDGQYFIVTDRWQNFTNLAVCPQTLEQLSDSCSEFLVHGADVEGLKAGMEDDLITMLGQHSPIPVTYAGGAKQLEDFDHVANLGQNRVDLTMGSALDIFGGDVPHEKVIDWHQKRNP